MKAESTLRSHFNIMTLSIAIFCIISVWPCVGQELDSTVQKAYELRIQGKVDDAQALLEKTILQDSNNAAAHYELARIQLHRALGKGGRNLIDMIGNAQETIEKALELNPNSVIYLHFAGHVYFMQAYYALMTGNKSNEQLAKSIGAFKSALQLKPDYHQAALCLVELYSQFPTEAGGDS